MRFDDRVVLVTGAGSGIGRDTALAFGRAGATVAVLDVRGDRARQTAEMAAGDGGTAEAFVADIRDPEQVDAAVAATVQRFGRIDALVNNAGTIRIGSVVDLSLDDWDTVINVNLRGTFLVSKAVLPGMIARGSGAIVNMGSISGLRGEYAACAYNASKAAIVNLTRSMALDFGSKGVRVNCICPGPVETPVLVRSYDDATRAAMGGSNPMGRLAHPAEIASAILFLCSDYAAYVNGAVLVADGGLISGTGLSFGRP